MILIGGGSRSGKSRAALDMLEASGARLGFIATAQAFDGEMRDRIALHRKERKASIVTWEEPLTVKDRIRAEHRSYDAIVVDCLTLWVTNLMLQTTAISFESEYLGLIEAAADSKAKIIMVTNEVGCGIVPENALARRFRDETGRLNQLAAQHASEVYWMVFGIGMRVK